MELKRRSPELPNPAVYALETNLAIPIRGNIVACGKTYFDATNSIKKAPMLVGAFR